jgi:hypothetical protein
MGENFLEKTAFGNKQKHPLSRGKELTTLPAFTYDAG